MMNTDTITSAKTPEIATHLAIKHGAWPLVGLYSAIDFAESLQQKFAIRPIFIEKVSESLKGQQELSQQIGAAVHYGLLKKFKTSYQFTPLFLQYRTAAAGPAKKELLLQMFGYPSLYHKMIDRYDGRSIPDDLEAQIVRFFRVTRKASPAITELFFQNCAFTGVLEENKLQYKKLLADTKQAARHGLNGIIAARTELILPNGRTALLLHPGELTAQDILSLQQQIALLA